MREQKEEEARKKKAVWGRERNGRDGSVPAPQDSLDAMCLSGLSRAQRLLGPRPPSGSPGTEGLEPKSFDFHAGASS